MSWHWAAEAEGHGGAMRGEAVKQATPIGIARLSKLMFDGHDLTPLWRDASRAMLRRRCGRAPAAAA